MIADTKRARVSGVSALAARAERLEKAKKIAPWLWSAVRLLLLIGISYVILYPLLVKMSQVFMSRADLDDITVRWVPRHFTLENVRLVGALMHYWPALLRSVGWCGGLSLLQLATCTLAGCGFARFKFRGRNLAFVLVVGTLVVPPQTYSLTLYTVFQKFDVFGMVSIFNNGEGASLLQTAWPMLLLSATGMGIRSGLFIYLLRQTFRGLPKELEEAAYVDGAGAWRTFFSVLMPNALSTMLVAFILSFVWQWNDTFYSNLFSPGFTTMIQVMRGVRTTITQYLGGWQTLSDIYASSLVNTATLLAVLPVILLYIICQRFFVQGVERSGLVG
ncbi:MAG: carbohydrate ABC transporter permease [Oscillospiraceae bacterium]|jgi:multiple sugar transport system permease protein|nr:carbohydrate ABC transporter permease [Oscillospiraceae bacterium]